MADGDAERSLTEMRMARAISDEVSRRDINTIRELRVLAEVGLDRRIDERIEQKLRDWKAHTLNPELERVLLQVSRMQKDYIDKLHKALDERLQAVGHFVGEWKASNLYHRGQCVRYNGGFWYCTAPGPNNLTPNEFEPTCGWQLRCRGMPDLPEEFPVRAMHSNGNGLSHDAN